MLIFFVINEPVFSYYFHIITHNLDVEWLNLGQPCSIKGQKERHHNPRYGQEHASRHPMRNCLGTHGGSGSDFATEICWSPWLSHLGSLGSFYFSQEITAGLKGSAEGRKVNERMNEPTFIHLSVDETQSSPQSALLTNCQASYSKDDVQRLPKP